MMLPVEHETVPVLEKLALQLLDSSVKSDDEQLNRFAEKFHAGIETSQAAEKTD